MKDENCLRGWKRIEEHVGLSRKTILARKMPIRKDGGVYAFKDELDRHMRRSRTYAFLRH